MNSKKPVKYRVWNGAKIVELDYVPDKDDGIILRASGLFDQEQREIYECDIVVMTPLRKDMPAIRGAVEYDEDKKVFYVRHGANLARLDVEWHNVEIVGNAFEEI